MSTQQTEREGLALTEIVTASLSFLLITVLVIILLQILFHVVMGGEIDRKNVVSAEAVELEAAQLAKLDEPLRWVDAEAGRVGMPIEDAMAAVVRRHGGDAAER